jgi:hypothetical protein
MMVYSEKVSSHFSLYFENQIYFWLVGNVVISFFTLTLQFVQVNMQHALISYLYQQQQTTTRRCYKRSFAVVPWESQE